MHMTATAGHREAASSPTAAPAELHPHQTITPRLARRDVVAPASARAWISPGLGASTAFISLSPGLVCVFDAPGRAGLTHQDIGAMGMSTHQAWNAAAETLVGTATHGSCLELWVRDAAISLGEGAPRGLEIRGGTAPAASWLAHPRTFGALQTHCAGVFESRWRVTPRELTYLSRDQRELFVFAAPAHEVAQAVGSPGVVRYSLGFPLLYATRAAVA